METVKLSKAAREFAARLVDEHRIWFSFAKNYREAVISEFAAEAQSALADLLEKAAKVLLLTHEHISPTLAKELRLELHRWRKP